MNLHHLITNETKTGNHGLTGVLVLVRYTMTPLDTKILNVCGSDGVTKNVKDREIIAPTPISKIIPQPHIHLYMLW